MSSYIVLITMHGFIYPGFISWVHMMPWFQVVPDPNISKKEGGEPAAVMDKSSHVLFSCFDIMCSYPVISCVHIHAFI